MINAPAVIPSNGAGLDIKTGGDLTIPTAAPELVVWDFESGDLTGWHDVDLSEVPDA